MQNVNGRIGTVRAMLRFVLSMIEQGRNHLGVPIDQVVECFRNELYAGYRPAQVWLRRCYPGSLALEEAPDAMVMVDRWLITTR
jgi:hypothetical protein